MFELKTLITFAVIFLTASGMITSTDEINQETLEKFKSKIEMKEFLEKNTINQYRAYWYDEEMVFDMAVTTNAAQAESSGATKSSNDDFSQTNIQVQGVDEADFVKTDGKHIYTLSNNELFIVDSTPTNPTILSSIEFENSAFEFFINGDKLVVFSSGYDHSNERYDYGYYGSSVTTISIYDIQDRSDVELLEEYQVDGSYFDSRMVGDFIYVISTNYFYGAEPLVPVIMDSNEKEVGSNDVYYIDEPAYSYMFTNIISINLEENSLDNKLYLTSNTQDMHVSNQNIYLTSQKVKYYDVLTNKLSDDLVYELAKTTILEDVPELNEQKTQVSKFSFNEGEVSHVATGSVDGYILNQFSMDEFDGNFRIATTIGNLWDEKNPSTNNIYVLDEKLNQIGELEGLAPGERIYSARFMGEKGYLVTFKKVDPLFVIDLKDPNNPEVLGKLKIPGYSDYLHPYSEDYLIGIGKDAVESETGDFAWYQGVKMALFDVSDVENPKELSQVIIGDRGTDSDVLYDHKAFLFNKEKNLLVLPITLAEIDEEKYPNGVSGNTFGEYTFQGAYVFSFSEDLNFELDGRITHVEDESQFDKYGWYYYGVGDSIKRSIYIGDFLYTISDEKIQVHHLESLKFTSELDLPVEVEEPYYYE